MYRMTPDQLEAIRKILDLPDTSAFSVIVWQPVTVRPEDASYVLLRYREAGEIFPAPAAYERGKFSLLSGDIEIPESWIIGWSYYPDDDRL